MILICRSLNDQINEIKKEIKENESLAADDRPTIPSAWEMRTRKKELMIEIVDVYIEKAAKKAEKKIETQLQAQRHAWLEMFISDVLREEIINEQTFQIVSEAIAEGDQSD
jgi:hypothetical protein